MSAKSKAELEQPSGTPSTVLEAFAPAPAEFYGVKLHRVTLGHAMALDRSRNAFVTRDVPITPEEAGKALWLLSMPPEEAIAAAAREDFADAARAWWSALPARAYLEIVPRAAALIDAAFAPALAGEGEDGPAPLAESAGG